MVALPIMVTGGAGYIGSHVCKALHKAGYLPITVDDLSHGRREAVRWGPLVPISILDISAMRAAFAQYRPHAVIHLAGRIHVSASMEIPLDYYDSNVTGSLILARVMQEMQCRHLVFSSTAAVYGTPAHPRPLRETDATAPINVYGHSKHMAEIIFESLPRLGQLRYAALRYFNAAGADPEGDIGECHHPETHLIPCILQAAQAGRPVSLYGDDYDTKDGTCIRDFVHVSDLAESHVQALRYIEGSEESLTVNIGSGTGYSVREVLRAVETIIGQSLQIDTHPRRAGDPPYLVADCRKAQRLLGWAPHFHLPDMIRHAWQWEQQRR